MDRRNEHRVVGANVQYPVACVMRHAGKELVAEVVNYHYRGACLRLPEAQRSEFAVDAKHCKLDFYLGRLCLQSDIPYRVCWDDLEKSGTLGIEFVARQHRVMERGDRFLINLRHPPRVEAKDPLDPNRILLLEVQDVSETGMLLQTSLTNKHLFPGMRLQQATVIIPGQSPMLLDMSIENARQGASESTFSIGVSIVGDRAPYKQALRAYLSQLVPMQDSADDHLSKLSEAGFLSNKLKSAISYRTVTTDADYEEVLKLRFVGYGKHAKVKAGTTWRDQGEGMDKEGLIIAGFLGGKIVCSMELRFGTDPRPLRTEALIGKRDIPGLDLERTVEINKLVIHPKAQGSDLVLGLFQKAHAIIVNRGHLDVLLAATDRLARLYSGIGAELLNVRVPHPYLTGEHLNLMAVRRQVYHDGLRFNPHAWNTIYQAVHEHFVTLGLATERILTSREKVKLVVGRRLEPFAKKFAKRGRSQKQKRPLPTAASVPLTSGGFVDPKWTRQEFLATVMHPYVVEATEMVGAETVDRILDGIGVPRSYIGKQSNWLSIAFHDELLDRFSAFGDPVELSRRAGIRSFKRDMIGVNYYVLKHFITPLAAFQASAKLTQKFNRTRTYDVIDAGEGRVRVAIGVTSPAFLPRRRESCANWQASFEGFIELMTGSAGKVRKLSCCYEGQRACTYEITWVSGRFKGLASFSAMIGLGMTTMATGWAHSRFGGGVAALTAGVTSLSVAVLALVAAVRGQNRRLDAATREFEGFQKEAGEKYTELQDSKSLVDEMYREARVLEKTAQEIQRNDSLGDILRTALDAACKNFEFDRAFAMLVDGSRKVLRTAAVSGVEDQAAPLWQFSVDVSQKRKDGLPVLSTVFHSGNPIMINDVDAHLFQLNEASRQLIKAFGSQGFIIVQVPGRDGCWGVIVADKKSKERILDRRDITVLERLGQQLGIALDKRADFEREERLRNHFQRYVPAAVVAEGLGQELPVLGGQIREIVAMFVDIRGFTAMAQGLSPAATVEVLNRFFSVLEPIVTEFGGVIDKYLGDGALITWGSLGTATIDTTRPVQAALKLLDELDRLNAELVQGGQRRLEVGIGLHRGPAIVGNIGSQNRVEFTCIGSTVNLASRLEAECKTLGASIVASEAMGLGETFAGVTFEVVGGVQVRGLDDAQQVWVHRRNVSGIRAISKRTAA